MYVNSRWKYIKIFPLIIYLNISSTDQPRRFFLKSYGKEFQQRSMGNFHQLLLVVVIIQVSMSFSARMFSIYRGKIDRYSRDIMNSEQATTCDAEYCTCSQSKRTFTYDKTSQKGSCVKNDDFRTLQGKNYTFYTFLLKFIALSKASYIPVKMFTRLIWVLIVLNVPSESLWRVYF